MYMYYEVIELWVVIRPLFLVQIVFLLLWNPLIKDGGLCLYLD